MIYCCMVFVLLFIESSFAENVKPNIAVMDLEGNGVSKNELGGLSNRLRTELFKTGKFTVIERSRVDEILKEQGFQQAGCTNATCAVEVGQLIGVEKIVVGNVDKVGKIYSIDIRMVDVGTGRIEKVAAEDCESCTIGEVLKQTIYNVAKILSGISTDKQAEVDPDTRKNEKAKKEEKRKPKRDVRKKSIDTAATVGKRYFMIDALGFLVFGPTVDVGIRLGRFTTAGLNVRFAGLGFIGRRVMNIDAKMKNLATGVRVDRLFGRKSSRSNFYVSNSLQMQFLFFEDDSPPATEGNDGMLIAMTGFGRRWRFHNGMFINLGAFFGFGWELWDKYWYKDNPSDEKKSSLDRMPGGGAELCFGIEF
jgi:TolB-like protein